MISDDRDDMSGPGDPGWKVEPPPLGHRRPLGRARPARDDEETRRVKTKGGSSLTAAQADADATPVLVVDPTIKPPVSPERIVDLLEERELEEWRRLRNVQRAARLEELAAELGDCSNVEELARGRYVEDLEDEEREHAATINQCAVLALRVIELEEELGRGLIGRAVWIAGLNELEGTWVEAILLGGKMSLGSPSPDDSVPVTRPLAEVRFVFPVSGVVSDATGGEHDQE